MPLKIEVEGDREVKEFIHKANVSGEKLARIMKLIAIVCEKQIKTLLTRHVRTGLTRASIESRILTETENEVVVAVGSWRRASQLRWLDRGRREVRPVTRRALRWWTWPGREKVFAMRARATSALNVLRQAALHAWALAEQIVKSEVK